ncbi:hypothetical protein ACJX0J_022437, partial [Zea mays]
TVDLNKCEPQVIVGIIKIEIMMKIQFKETILRNSIKHGIQHYNMYQKTAIISLFHNIVLLEQLQLIDILRIIYKKYEKITKLKEVITTIKVNKNSLKKVNYKTCMMSNIKIALYSGGSVTIKGYKGHCSTTETVHNLSQISFLLAIIVF